MAMETVLSESSRTPEDVHFVSTSKRVSASGIGIQRIERRQRVDSGSRHCLDERPISAPN